MLRLRFEGLQNLTDRLQHVVSAGKSRMAEALERSAQLVETEAKQTMYRNPPQTLGQHTGGPLRASMTHRVEAARLRALVGSALKYAPVHEYGATIKAKNKPYLMFKVSGQPAGLGATRITYRLNKYTGKRRAVMAKNQGPSHWVRVKQVTIPARPFLGPALERKRGEIREELAAVLQGLLDGK